MLLKLCDNIGESMFYFEWKVLQNVSFMWILFQIDFEYANVLTFLNVTVKWKEESGHVQINVSGNQTKLQWQEFVSGCQFDPPFATSVIVQDTSSPSWPDDGGQRAWWHQWMAASPLSMHPRAGVGCYPVTCHHQHVNGWMTDSGVNRFGVIWTWNCNYKPFTFFFLCCVFVSSFWSLVVKN